jgi:hypothetical protein
MVVRLKFFGAGKFSYQKMGLVDQNGKVLGTDIELLVPIIKCQQRDFLVRFLTNEAFRVIISHVIFLIG